ncbi:hypothetical protein J6590_085854 [Homalodisca vitripennis]|nr:hypothetical protein J6590_085854 [Homalodisca vitripennis]
MLKTTDQSSQRIDLNPFTPCDEAEPLNLLYCNIVTWILEAILDQLSVKKCFNLARCVLILALANRTQKLKSVTTPVCMFGEVGPPHGIKQITVGPPHGIKQITMFIRENVECLDSSFTTTTTIKITLTLHQNLLCDAQDVFSVNYTPRSTYPADKDY